MQIYTRGIRTACACLLLGWAAVFSLKAQQPAVSPARPIGNTQPPPMNTSLVAPLVIESSDWTSVLTLVNESMQPVHVQLALRSTEDMMSANLMKTVMLAGHTSRRVPIAALLNGAAPDFIGSLTANVQEPEAAMNMAVAAQVTIAGQGNFASASIDEELSMPEMGSNLKSVASGSSALLAIQNSGMAAASATVTCLAHGVTKQVIL